jgi:hypothetical protein
MNKQKKSSPKFQIFSGSAAIGSDRGCEQQSDKKANGFPFAFRELKSQI